MGVALSLQEHEWLESILDVGKEKQENLQVVKREAIWLGDNCQILAVRSDI